MIFRFEDEFADLLDDYSPALQKSYEKLKSEDLSLDNLDYSRLIANRIRAYYQAQEKANNFLGKKKAQSGSDFFVETIIFALKLFVEVEGLALEISSEKALSPTRGAARPDISLWRENSCVGIIECKTQLGYQRFSWLSQFEKREKELHKIFPDAKKFLLVMTTCNWHGFKKSEPRAGFDKNDPRVGKQFFCLFGQNSHGHDIWPRWMPEDLSKDNFEQTFEQLLEKIRLL